MTMVRQCRACGRKAYSGVKTIMCCDQPMSGPTVADIADSEAEGRRLVESGYRATSNKYRMASRLDRPDWREAMADYQTGGFPGDKAKNRADGMRWVAGLGSGAADFYRRVISKDTLCDLPDAVFRVVRAAGSHGWGGCDEYLEIVPPSSSVADKAIG